MQLKHLFCIIASASSLNAALFNLDLQGNAGFGLLPGNEVGSNTPVDPGPNTSTSFGGEIGSGFVLDTTANTLEFAFDFTLTGGSTLADVASGIHLHLVSDSSDPFNSTGPIGFNLNAGTDPNIALNQGPVAIGATGGTLAGLISNLTPGEEQDFLDGNYYVNIHTNNFSGGELRANVVPEPSVYGVVIGFIALGVVSYRRRQK